MSRLHLRCTTALSEWVPTLNVLTVNDPFAGGQVGRSDRSIAVFKG